MTAEESPDNQQTKTYGNDSNTDNRIHDDPPPSFALIVDWIGILPIQSGFYPNVRIICKRGITSPMRAD